MKNELRHLDDFKQILSNYKVSEEAREKLAETTFVLLAASTSAGRNAIARELLKSEKYHYVVSDTTRHPRENDGIPEKNGREYWFKSEEEVLEGLKQGKYLEAAIIHNQQVSGISVNEIVISHQQNKIAIKDIEVQGARTFLKLKPDIISIYVLPPNLEEWMRRLRNRGEMNDDEFKRRLQSSVGEFDYAVNSDQFIFIINDKLDVAVNELRNILENAIADNKKQIEGRNLAVQLKEEVKKLLSTLD